METKNFSKYAKGDLMTKKKIFISYDYDKDKTHKNLLLAWDKNKIFDFSFTDESADTSINSNDVDIVKRAISLKINQSDIFLCLIGQYTIQSKWVKWEIEKAIELEKKIMAVKIKKDYESPEEIKNANAKWAMAFTFDAIKKSIEELNMSFTIYKGVKKEPVQINQPSKPWNIG